MRVTALRRVLMMAVIACAASAAVRAVEPRDGKEPAAWTMLGVTGRANATPWIAADGPFVAIVWGVSAGERKSDVFLAISRDSGVTFGAPARVNVEPGEARLGGELPPRVVLVKAAATAADPEVVVLWTARGTKTAIKVARSRDGGRTFGAPVSLQTPDAAGDRGWPSLAADNHGAIHAIWLDHRGLAGMTKHQHGAGRQSGTGTSGAAAAGAAAPSDGAAMAQRSGLYYASLSANLDSATAPADRELTPGVCYCCKTALAVGKDGALLAAWRQVYPGDLRDIAFAISRDGGRTFSTPTKVSEDRWEINGCPDDGPAMTVGADGTIHVVWPTVVMTGDDPQGALFYTSSRDGRTFTPRQRIPTLGSPKPMHPQVVVDDAGRISVAWDEFVEGNRRVAAMRALQPKADGSATFGPVLTLGAATVAAQYPIVARTSQGLLAVWTSGAADASTIAVQRVDLSHSDRSSQP